MLQTEFILCFVVVLIITFTNAGGLAGGGIMVPVMIGLYGFDPKSAIAINNFAVPWSCATRYFAHLNMSHPLKNGKGIAVDYNVFTLVIPSTIVGASIGSIVNLMLPAPIILVLFIIATFAMVYQALRKYCSLLKSEKGVASINSLVAGSGTISLATIGKPKQPIIKNTKTSSSSENSHENEKHDEPRQTTRVDTEAGFINLDKNFTDPDPSFFDCDDVDIGANDQNGRITDPNAFFANDKILIKGDSSRV